MVRTLAVTSSPREPSPRVAPRTQPAVLVGERDAQAVDLQLGDVGDRRRRRAPAAPSRDALVEGAQLLLVVRVVEAEHRHEVLDRREALDRPPADALRRRIGGDEIRMLRLEPLELVQQPIELLVGDLGIVVDVVALFVMPDGIAQLARARFSTSITDLPGPRRHEDTKTRRENQISSCVFVSSCLRGCIVHPDTGQSGGPSSGGPSSSPATSANARYAGRPNSTSRTRRSERGRASRARESPRS